MYARGLEARSVFQKHQVTQEKIAFSLNNESRVRKSVNYALNAQKPQQLEFWCAPKIQSGGKIWNDLPCV